MDATLKVETAKRATHRVSHWGRMSVVVGRVPVESRTGQVFICIIICAIGLVGTGSSVKEDRKP